MKVRGYSYDVICLPEDPTCDVLSDGTRDLANVIHSTTESLYCKGSQACNNIYIFLERRGFSLSSGVG